MKTRTLVRSFTLLFCTLFCLVVQSKDLGLRELNLSQTQAKLLSGNLTMQQLADYYLQRIQALDKGDNGLNSVAIINPELQQQLQALQMKINQKHPLGDLFGALVVVKDNIDIKGMPNTAGSWLMRDHSPQDDAFLIQRLKQQDAIILGKTNLSE